MTDIRSPLYSADDTRRARHCRNVFNEALSKLLGNAVAAGWRQEEVALQIADLADDLVMDLASRRLSRPQTQT